MESHITEIKGQDSAGFWKALASEVRLDILELLQQQPMGIGALAEALGLSRPTVARHIEDLEAVGLVTTDPGNGDGGQQKICRPACDRFIIAFEDATAVQDQVIEIETPVGLYSQAQAVAPCGLASEEALIGYPDDPQSFFLPERSAAQLLWTSAGFVEYVFPSRIPADAVVSRLEISVEICSEAQDYNNDFPSDITMWVNNVEIGTWTSPGDYGGKRGRLNPAWWADNRTQFGMLKVWSVDDEASYIDGSVLSDRTLGDLMLIPGAPVVVRIGNKPDARYVGGFNIFGRGFGNYRQDIVLRLHYPERRGERP